MGLANKKSNAWQHQEEIIKMYTESYLSAKEIGDKINCKIDAIYDVLRFNNINPVRNMRINSKKEKIILLYKDSYSMKQIAKMLNCDYSVIKRILKKENIELRPQKFYIKGKPAPKLGISEKKVIEMYGNQYLSGVKIAKKYNCNNSTIYDILNKNKIKIKGAAFFNKGRISNYKGKSFEETYGEERANEIKERISNINKEIWKKEDYRNKLSKENASNWLGGKSFEPYTPDFNKILKEAIKARDNYSCLKCGLFELDAKKLYKKSLHIHHIDYMKKNTIKENCCALCMRCNVEVNYNRSQWTKFFQSILAERYGYQYAEDGTILLSLTKLNTNNLCS